MNGFIGTVLSCMVIAALSCTQGESGRVSTTEVFHDPRINAIVRAACSGNIEELNSPGREGIDINTSGRDGENLLFPVLACENDDGLTALLSLGANPNHVAHLGATPVTVAATYHDSRHLEILLNHGGNKNATRQDGETALTIAFRSGVRNGWWDAYYLLLSKGAEIASQNGSVISYAIDFGQYDKALELLESGHSDPHLGYLARTLYSVPLRSADEAQSRARLLQWMARNGVDLESARHWASENGKSEIVAALEGLRARG